MSDYRNDLVKYIVERFAAEDDVLKTVLANQEAGGGPMMHIGPDQGKFFNLLVKLLRPANVLEVGSYYGYSSIWLARAVKELRAQGSGLGGSQDLDSQSPMLHCIEVSSKQCEILDEHFKLAEVSDLVEIYQGSGIDIMNKFIDEGRQFEIVFIDADKSNYSNYLDLSAKLLPTGGLLLVDNCSWDGYVADPSNDDEQTNHIRAFNDKLARSQDFDSVIATIQDGLAFAIKR